MSIERFLELIETPPQDLSGADTIELYSLMRDKNLADYRSENGDNLLQICQASGHHSFARRMGKLEHFQSLANVQTQHDPRENFITPKRAWEEKPLPEISKTISQYEFLCLLCKEDISKKDAIEIGKYLAKHPDNLNKVLFDNNGETFAHLATRKNHHLNTILSDFMKQNAISAETLNMKNIVNNTPLANIASYQKNNAPLFRELIDAGADLNLEINSGLSIAEFAVQTENTAIFDVLEENDFKISTTQNLYINSFNRFREDCNLPRVCDGGVCFGLSRTWLSEISSDEPKAGEAFLKEIKSYSYSPNKLKEFSRIYKENPHNYLKANKKEKAALEKKHPELKEYSEFKTSLDNILNLQKQNKYNTSGIIENKKDKVKDGANIEISSAVNSFSKKMI